MKRLSSSGTRVIACLVALGLVLGGGRVRAAELQEAQVTVVIKDVQLLPSQAAARAAALNDSVRQGTAVRTGTDSRTELTFTDQTIARMGQNTLFSFDAGTRKINLGSGVMLVHVPKGSGGAKISTAGVTAGVTGTTLMVEYHKRAPAKLIVMEGVVRMWLTLNPVELKVLHAGQMLVVPPNATKLPEPETVDLEKLMNTALLVTEFPPLPSLALIAAEIAKQQAGGGPWETEIDPTNIDDISQAFAAFPPVALPPRPPVFGTTITYGGAAAGNWSNPASWIPPVVPNNTPSQLYTAIMNSGTVFQDIAAGVIIQQLQMNGGIIVLTNPLRLNTGLLYTDGTFSGGNLFIAGTSTQSAVLKMQNTNLTNSGTYDITFDSSNAFSAAGSSFTNTGTLRKTTGSDVVTFNLPLNNSGTVSVLNGAMSFSGGGTNSGIFSAAGGAVINFASDFSMLNGTTFTGPGVTSFNDGTHTTLSGTITNNRAIFVNSAGTLTDFILNGDVTLTGGGTIFLTSADRILGNGILNNVNNAIRGDTAGGGSIGADQIGIINGVLGVIDANTGLLDVDPNASGLVNHGVMQASLGGTLRLSGNGAGGFSSDGTIQATSGGALQFNGAVTSTGLVDVGNNSLTVGGSYTQTAGTFHMVGGTVVSATTLDFQGGMVDAHGSITGSLNNGGTLLPALGGSGLSVSGNVTLLNSSHLSFQLGGLTQGTQYSFLNVNGSVALSGQLVLSFANGFQNSVTGADVFNITSATGGVSGAFSNVAPGTRLNTSDGFGSFIVNYGGNSIVLSNFIPTPVINSATWTDGNGNWSDPTNWSSNPRFPNNGQPNPGDVYDATLANGGAITLDIPITIEHLTLSNGTITGTQPLTLNQLFTWSGGNLGGGITVNANGGIDIGGAVALNDGIITNAAGQVVAMSAPGAQWTFTTSSTFNNNGEFRAQNNSGLLIGAGGGMFNNAGTFTRDTAAGTFVVNTGFVNTGAVNVATGTLAFNGGDANNTTGDFNIAAGATLVFNNAFAFQASSDIAGAGTVNFSGGAQTISGTFTVPNLIVGGSANTTFNIPLNLSTLNLFAGATLNSTSSNVISGVFGWNGGTLAGSGTFTANGGINLSNSAVALNAGIVNNSAGQTTTMSGASVLSMSNGARFNNNGIFLAQNNGSISNAGGVAALFNNNGVFTRDTAVGTFTIGVDFNNTSIVNVNSGVLDLSGVATSSGPINVNPNASLNLGGTFTDFSSSINLFSGDLSVSGTAACHQIAGTSGTINIGPGASLTVASGLLFPGNNGTIVLPPTAGGSLTITSAPTVSFDAAGINGANFNGGDADPTSNDPGGDGGILDVTSTTGDININTPINATTGGNGAVTTGGTGGTVNLTTTQGAINVANRIQVSDRTAGRRSAAGGQINLTSNAPTGVAVNITSTGQLLSLLDAAAPGPGGKIIIRATGTNSQINVGGAIAADHNTTDPSLIDIRQTGPAGQITLTNANLSADIIKVAAIGDNGRLTIGGGNISANTILRLYAGGTTGQIFFIADCNISSGTELSIAANTVHIDNGVQVNVTGPQAQVYTNNAQYVGGNQPTTGQFVGSGANTNLGLPPPPLRPGRSR